MRKSLCVISAVLAVTALLPLARAQDKATGGTVKVKVNYTGSGAVDDKHKILVFLFDSPAFTQGAAMPIASQPATSKQETVTFSELSKSPVYVAIVYDPKGEYAGMSPPPSGSSLGMYSKNPPEPTPVEVKEGQTVEVEVAFDDSQKM